MYAIGMEIKPTYHGVEKKEIIKTAKIAVNTIN